MPRGMPEDWRGRVVEEANDLAAKLSRLSAFVVSPGFGRLDPVNQSLLLEQHQVTGAYLRVLAQRLAVGGNDAAG